MLIGPQSSIEIGFETQQSDDGVYVAYIVNTAAV